MKNTSALTIIISLFAEKVNIWYIFFMLKVDSLSYKVVEESSRLILDNISFEITKGGLLVITGPNGSGKSTLAQIIMGFKKQTSGRVFFNDTDISDLPINERARLGISFSFQQPVRFKGIKVYDLLNIARGELISPEEAGEFLKKVGLSPEEYLDREVNGRLSGGELKRIEIASVLARDADLMIFDEPEAGIDLWSFNDLIQVFQKLRNKKKSIIIISHQEKILKVADEIIILENGKIKKKGEPSEVLPEVLGVKNGN